MNVTLCSIAVSTVFSCGLIVLGEVMQNEQSTTKQEAVAINNLENNQALVNTTSTYILQANDIDNLMKTVEDVGGEVVETYPSLNSINARLTQNQYHYLNQNTDFIIRDHFLALN